VHAGVGPGHREAAGMIVPRHRFVSALTMLLHGKCINIYRNYCFIVLVCVVVRSWL
jgi:hypothetical protein